MRAPTWRAGFVALVTLLAGGCGDDSPPPPAPAPPTIDVRAGTYRGIGVGDAVPRLRSVFGPAPRRNGRRGFGDFQPPAKALDLPGIPDADQDPPFQPEPYYGYPEATFLTISGRIRGVFVHAAGARTREGVAIGDPLAEVRRAYPGWKCLTSIDERDGRQAECWGRAAPRRYAWFGGDPINVVYLSGRPFS